MVSATRGVKVMQYCTRCVYPAVSASPLTFDAQGVCTGCRTHEEQKEVDWDQRRRWFEELIEDYRSRDGSNYDVIIPVSGGKDSFWQAHIITKVYGLKALFVCYAENNHTDVGMRNIQRMKETFRGDFLHFTPEVEVLKKLNRLGMIVAGDPNWHTHAGIMTLPIRTAVQLGIKLFVYGEHGFMNLGGMHSYKDMVEWTRRYWKEHALHSFDWHDFVEGTEGLTPQDLLWCQYPSDEDVERVGVRGIFISNYFGWNQNAHLRHMIDLYGFEVFNRPFDRTYRRDSNINDVHDNGIHDYMKFVKFGYGRASDHASRDIRNGVITRTQGIEYVREYDHVVPGDIPRWLDYVGWTRRRFEAEADRFRDPRVWSKDECGNWIKDNIWDFEARRGA